jgi:hypothetical protein
MAQITRMKCLTNAECSDWLRNQRMVEEPYGEPLPVGSHYKQFAPPTSARHLAAFSRHLFDWLGNYDTALLHITDWGLYKPDEMAVIQAIRRSHGEHRMLIDAPGHLFEAKERDELIGMFYLTVMFGWSAYLYFPAAKATIFNWEGDLIDLWSADAEHFSKFSSIIDTFQLRVTGRKNVTAKG